MNEKGIFTSKDQKSIAKIADALLDFNKIFGTKKVFFGLIKVGNFLEKRDRKWFQAAITYLDDTIVEGKLSEENREIFISIVGLIKAKDIEGLNTYLSRVIASKVNFLGSNEAEEKIFSGFLSVITGLTQKGIEKASGKVEELIATANQQGE